MERAVSVAVAMWLCACAGGDGPMTMDAGLGEPEKHLDASADVGEGDHYSQRTMVAARDLEFTVRVAGPANGEAVLLLHGFPQTSAQWSAQIAALAGAGYRVVAPDQRGYSPGARPSAVSAYAMQELVHDVLALADALHISRFHLVGHDWGAYVAWFLAGRAPERLHSLATLSIPHPDAFVAALLKPMSCQLAASAYVADLVAADAEAGLLQNDAARLRTMYDDLPQTKVDEYLAIFREEDALRGGVNWYRANPAIGSADLPLGPVHVPTLHIWSDLDKAVCRDGAEITSDYVSAPYRLEILQGVSHWAPEMSAMQVNTLLLEHLRTYAGKQ